jgi:Zn-dependent metalloprotease
MKRFTFSLLLSFFFISICANGQIKPIQSHFKEKAKAPSYLEFDLDNAPTEGQLFDYIKQYLKSPNELTFKLVRSEKDQLGYVHQLYQQQYNGTPIEFGEIRVHLKGNKVHSINGNFSYDVPAFRESSISEGQALSAAKDFVGANVYKWEIAEEEQMLKVLFGAKSTYMPKGELCYISSSTVVKPQELRLAYKFNIYAHEPMSRQEVYVDASTAEVIFWNDLIHTNNVPGSAVTAYSGTRTITTDSVSPTLYHLTQTASGNGISTWDLNQGTTFGNAVDFVDSDNTWNNSNLQLDQYATDAHWGAEQTYDYFFTKFNRNSINNNGFALNSFVHYSSNYVNAFWNGQFMTYGDGGNGVTPLTALDIAAHEITHGLTNFSANLIYQSESGALNESFSDIFGAAIEFYARPNNANWTLGEDIGLTLRSLSNPNSRNDPDTRRGTFWRQVIGCTPSGQNDNCGVHTNSGVQNFWFYLLTTGGSGTNDLNNSYAVSGIGIDKAAAIAFRNLTVYLGRTSDYDDARFYSIKSAIDLYGTCSAEVQAVTNAWYAVGVGRAYVPGVVSDFEVSDTSTCQPPFQVSFTNYSSNGIDFFWDFGDGQSSTQREPVHTYNTYGNFDVKLVVDGDSCGIDSLIKQSLISVDTSNLCAITLVNGVNPTQTECNGLLFDTGGSNGNYSNNENATITIAPPNSASVTLTFNSFDIESGTANNLCDYDYIEIFDGLSTSSPSLGRYCNTNTPPTTITSSRGAITIEFSSDPGLVRSGFEIDWSCTYPTAPPVADFDISTDTSCTGEVSFRDLSSQAPSSWFWDFGDGNSSLQAEPIHYYTVNGTYTVSLIAGNSFGNDTVVKSNIVHVNMPPSPTVSNDTVCIGQSVSLQASASVSAEWYTSQYGGNSVNTGSTLSINQLFNDTTFWVQNTQSPSSQFTGAPSRYIGSGNYYSGDQHLIFDVQKRLILESVFVFSNSAGSRTIELRDQNGVVLQSKTVQIPASTYRVTLDFLISPGQNYQLGISGGSLSAGIPDLYRNDGGVSYPYTLPGLISITGSSAGSSYYYFFYLWTVREPECSSPREEIKAIVDTNCNVVSVKELKAENQFNIYPNPASDEVFIKVNQERKIHSIKLYNSKSQMVLNEDFVHRDKQLYQLNTESLPAGLYFITINTGDSVTTKRLVLIK